MNNKRISPAAILALKEALTNIYWRKDELKQFVYQSIENKCFLATINFNQVKRQTAEDIVMRMAARQDIYGEDLLSLIFAITDMTDFSHLEKWEDGAQKVKKAQQSVDALRKQTQGYLQIQQEKQKKQENKKRYDALINGTKAVTDELTNLKKIFFDLSLHSNHQERGLAFEKFLNRLFVLYDLDSKCSYKAQGEQIDGAFVHDNQHYLIEAKWVEVPVPKSTIQSFQGKVRSKLKTTLGLFISINGFSKECVEYLAADDVILMDAQDILNVLEMRISLTDLLYRKKQRASQTGEVLFHPI